MLPFALYIDGVAFNRNDTIVAFHTYFIFGGHRHVNFVVRKQEFCNCGCKSWCTFRPVFDVLRWSFAAMMAGVWPSHRHDGSAWEASDASRALRSGTSLGFKAQCLFVKGDWAELNQRWGFPSWHAAEHPCPFCHCDATSMTDLRQFSPFQCTRREKTLTEYLAACARCEICVDLSEDDIRLLRPSVKFDVKLKGRGLTRDAEKFGLRKRDRLEPTLQYPNIAALDTARPTVWWRGANETLARHRNPLICEESGVSLRSFGIDWLHALSQGVYPHITGRLVWELISLDAWRVHKTSKHLAEMSVVHLRSELFSWYDSEQKQGRRPSRIKALTVGMLGAQDNPFMGLQAAESNSFLEFAQEVLLPWYGHLLGDRRPDYSAAIDSAMVTLRICREYKRKMPGRVRQEFCDACSHHLRKLSKLGLNTRPKHHQLLELASRPRR